MTDEMQALVLDYLERIDRKLDHLMRELVELRRQENEDLPPEPRDEYTDRIGTLLDKFAALSPEEQRLDIERANELLRQRMTEQPGASFMELDLSNRIKH